MHFTHHLEVKKNASESRFHERFQTPRNSRKARDRRPSAFIVSRCLEPLTKYEARVFEMTSQSPLKIQCSNACKINVFPAGMVNSSCKSLLVFWKLFVPCTQCFIAYDGYGWEEEGKTESLRFRCRKVHLRNMSQLMKLFFLLNSTKANWSLKYFGNSSSKGRCMYRF